MRTSRISFALGASLALLSAAPPASAQLAVTGGLAPSPFLRLKANPVAVYPKGDAEGPGKPPKEDPKMAAIRLGTIAARDKFAMPTERMPAMPQQFCVGNRCFRTHREVAAALYQGSSNTDKLSVFCAPRRLPGASKFNPKDPMRQWSIDKVYCSKDWGDTLGGYRPWLKNGQPNKAPERGSLPPYACFANPHLTRQHMVMAPGGAVGNSGFSCRKRVFRVLVTKAPMSMDEKMKNIAQMCSEMRQQVWGEKYGDINAEYQKWCRKKGKNFCLPKGAAAAGIKGAPALPFMTLSRDELMFFYGHKELYCRADRTGLTHFLYNKPWAQTFTCGIARGVIEAGPFEEGVQVCAIAPYYGARPPRHEQRLRDPYKARFHCWQFNRPTCEDISRDQKLDDIHRSNVFDAFDAMREFRRTRMSKVFTLYDLKDAEKLTDFSELLGYSDTGKDEGIFGVKEFCRFVGNMKTLECGHTKESIALWYEMRRDEEPSNCGRGVCERGAFKRGYLCGLFASPELFKGQPYWMCGLDVGKVGRDRIASAPALCLGGKAASRFQSSKGDTSSLQCFERRFRWGESIGSKAILDKLNWPKMVALAATKINEKRRTAGALTPADIAATAQWAGTYGHTLGHRTSLRIGLTRSKHPVVLAFQKHRFTALANPANMKPKEISDKVKSLNEIFQEVAKGDRAADDKWWNEFFTEAHEDKILRISDADFQLARKMSAVYAVLDGARAQLLKVAREYADEVSKKAKTERLLSRLELHERAREEKISPALKGNVFCVSDLPPEANNVAAATKTAKKRKAPKSNYICASSPLLMAGTVEQNVRARKKEFKPAENAKTEDYPRQYAEFKQKLRTQVRTEWCYGGTKDQPLFGKSPSPALYGLDLSSPYVMETARGVIDLAVAATNRKTPWLWKSAANWLKCAGFQYSDEHWQHSVPGGGRNAPATALAGAERIDPRIIQKVGLGNGAGAVTGMIGGLLGALINLVMPGLGDAFNRVLDMANASAQFLDKWTARYVDAAKEMWEQNKKEVDEAKAAVTEKEAEADELKGAIDQALDEEKAKVEEATQALADARTEEAAAQGPAKEAAAEKVVAAKNTAKQVKIDQKAAVKLAKQNHDKALKEVEALKAAQQKLLQQVQRSNKTIHRSGELLGEMLEDMTSQIMERIMATIEPKARDLVGRGFRFVRSVLGPVAKAVIGALASIPFVGGALAVLGQIAYDLALNALEEFAFEQLKGVVERVLAKILRGMLSPLMKEVQAQIGKSVHSACQAYGVCSAEGEMKFGRLPPRHRWLERAIGCTRRPIIDDEVYKKAVAARFEILDTARRYEEQGPAIAKLMANDFLAIYGLNYDQVMAAAKGDDAAKITGRFDEVVRALKIAARKLQKAPLAFK